MTPFKPKPRPMNGPAAPSPIDAPPPVRAPKPGIEAEPDADDDPASGGVTLEMLGYRDGSKHCETCSHFDGDSACDLDATTPVEAAGGCEAHSAEGQNEDDAFGRDEGPGIDDAGQE